MKITPKILHIPPFISTSWDQISSLYLQTKSGVPHLVIVLRDGALVEVPHLAQREIDEIFQAHANFSEGPSPSSFLDSPFSLKIPMSFDGSMLDSLASHLQHNPEQANLPQIPTHILSKIITILRSLGPIDDTLFDKPQPNCHCTYCQLSKAVQGEPEEVVIDADLKFRDWEVLQKDQKLYQVTNPLDQGEYYTVFLGEPIGCTCGSKNCEHIRAVLNT
jgi:hypothetical protein